MSNKYNHAWLRQQTFNKIKEIRPKIELEDEWAKQPGRVETALKNLHESDLDD